MVKCLGQGTFGVKGNFRVTKTFLITKFNCSKEDKLEGK